MRGNVLLQSSDVGIIAVVLKFTSRRGQKLITLIQPNTIQTAMATSLILHRRGTDMHPHGWPYSAQRLDQILGLGTVPAGEDDDPVLQVDRCDQLFTPHVSAPVCVLLSVTQL